MVRIPLQNLAEILESALAVGQLNPLDLRQPEAQLDVFLSALLPPQPPVEQVHQIVPAAQFDVERIQRRHRFRVARLQCPNPLPGRNGLFLPCQARRQAARLAPEGHLSLGCLGQVRPPQDDFVERAEILLLTIDSFQCRKRGVVIRPPLSDAAEVVNG